MGIRHARVDIKTTRCAFMPRFPIPGGSRRWAILPISVYLAL
jgi:hypothetical protein